MWDFRQISCKNSLVKYHIHALLPTVKDLWVSVMNQLQAWKGFVLSVITANWPFVQTWKIQRVDPCGEQRVGRIFQHWKTERNFNHIFSRMSLREFESYQANSTFFQISTWRHSKGIFGQESHKFFLEVPSLKFHWKFEIEGISPRGNQFQFDGFSSQNRESCIYWKHIEIRNRTNCKFECQNVWRGSVCAGILLWLSKFRPQAAEGSCQFNFIISIFKCKGGVWRLWRVWYAEENCWWQFWFLLWGCWAVIWVMRDSGK